MVKGKISKGKKGFDLSLTSVILGVVFIIVMVSAAPHIYNILFSQSDIEKCRASVHIKAASIKPTAGFIDIADLNLECHTKFLTAKKDGLFEGDKRFVNFNSREFENDDLEFNAKKAVADRMAECWYMFGQGKTDLYTKLGGDHCVPCYEIKFDDELQEEVPQLTDFGTFLVENDANPEQTYSQYLANADNFEFDADPSIIELETDKTYSIFYFWNSESLTDRITGTITRTASGCAIGAAAGAPFAGVGAGPGAVVGCKVGLAVGISAAITEDTTIGIGISTLDGQMDSCGKLY
jgi:hypothetical protein